MVPSRLMFVLSVVLVRFPIMYITLFSYVWIPESTRFWERPADSVYHMSHLSTDATSCCNVMPLRYCGRGLGPNCMSSYCAPSPEILQICLYM